MSESPRPPVHERWAHLRFSVVGPLLAAPPARGELQAALAELAEKSWLHPVSGAPTQFGLSTIERWYSAESFVMRRARPPHYGPPLSSSKKENTSLGRLLQALPRGLNFAHAV